MARASGQLPRTDRSPGPPSQIALLGTVVVRGPAGVEVVVTRPQVQVALAYLMIERRPVARGELADLFWGEAPLGPHWKGAIRGILSKLRDTLTEAGIDGAVDSSGDGTIRLALPEGLDLDIDQARRAVDRAEHALSGGDATGAAEIASLWTAELEQPVLPASDGDWVRAVQDRLADLSRRATTVRVAALLAGGRADLAADLSQSWVRRHPLDEGLHELLIRALIADGRRGEAIAAYDRLAAVLAAELGIGPSEATTALVGARSTPLPASSLSGAARRTVAAAPSNDERIFLGRHCEMDALESIWSATCADGRPHLVEITGKSGIGKTRLAHELCRVARTTGATIRWARCLPGTSVAFEPLASAVTNAPVAAPPGSAPPSDPTSTRGEAIAAIAGGMRLLAASPAVLVIDDLQWASNDMAAALEQTLVEITGPLLIVTTGRGLPPGVHQMLARLERVLPTTTVRLQGLAPEDLLPLFDRPAHDADQSDEGEFQASALHDRTDGHPFFISEMAIAPWRAGRPIDLSQVPDGIRSWIGHRADALSKEVRSRLDLAAVIGDECDVAVMARGANAPADEVVDHLEILVDEGFLVETERVDVFAFAHLITRDAVYERIGPTRRARQHAAVADALASVPVAPGRTAAIAHHLRSAGPKRATDAGEMLLLAGREALDAGAWSEAEQQYRQAHLVAPDEPHIRSGALTGLAQSLHLQRRRDEAEELLQEVLAIARAHRLPLEFAEAVLVLVGRAGRGATQQLSDLEQASLLREALAGLTELDVRRSPAVDARSSEQRHAQRVRHETLACQVEGELAIALALTATPEERGHLAQSAVARARALNPPDTRLTARALLISRLSRIEPDSIRARIDDLDQVLAIAPSGRGLEATLTASTYRYEDLLLCGDREGAQGSLADAIELAERSEHPYWTWATAAWKALDTLIDGDLEEAERLAFAAAARQGSEGGAQACLGVNLVNIRLYQGRSGEVLDLLDRAATASPHIPCYRAVHALCAIEAGDTTAAVASIETFRSTGFAEIPHDSNRLLTLVVLADTAVQLDDGPSAARLHDLLLPAASLHAVLNCYGGGGAYWGPVAHQLARLCALRGDRDGADRWFDQAEASARKVSAPLALARITREARRPPRW